MENSFFATAALTVLNIIFQHWLIEYWLIEQANFCPIQTLQSRTEQYMGGSTFVIVGLKSVNNTG